VLADRALVDLGLELKDRGYRFTTITPASHARVNARPHDAPPSLQDIFGWNRPFATSDVAEDVVLRLAEAGELETWQLMFRSGVRFSTLGEQLFVHSAFPTEQSDAVFFGPDTYRFARLVRHSLNGIGSRPSLRILDVGAGSGAGGLHAAALTTHAAPVLTLADINQRALRFSRINAALNGVNGVQVVESDLFGGVDGRFDLIISNPPYLVDPRGRLYRHGGGELGFEMSLKILEQGIKRLTPHGRLVVYTGSAIVGGKDLFREILSARLAPLGAHVHYEEIDPDVFGEELEHSPYDRVDRIAAVGVTIDVPDGCL
jgi:methylase of polypeptide subunit release factors